MTGHIDDAEMRNVVAAIAKQTKLTAAELEVQYCEREAGKKDKASIGLRALADRFKKIWDKCQQQGRKSKEDMEIWLAEKIGASPSGQHTIRACMIQQEAV